MIQFQEEVYQLTKELVHYPSISGTIGEQHMAYQIHEMLQRISYFRENPSQLRLIRTFQDDRERYHVFALLKGQKRENDETIILLGHMDTADVDQYDQWKRFAFSPDELLEEWKKGKIPTSVKNDLMTGDWLPGRGILDMKTGLAVNLSLMQYWAEHLQELPGNILFVATYNQMGQSLGMLSAVKEINSLAMQEKLTYIAAINQSYSTPRFEGDPSHYLYLGATGKLTPAFYVIGKEACAGKPFTGFDPHLLLAELTHRLHYNTQCCDELFGEVTPPPVSLHQASTSKDDEMNTPMAALARYHFFVHGWSPEKVLERLRTIATTAFEVAISKYQTRYRAYCELAGDSYQPIQIKPRVYTYEEFYNICRKKYPNFEKEILQFAFRLQNDQSLDVHDYSQQMIEELWKRGGDQEPAILLYYSSSYIPRVVLREEEPNRSRLLKAVQHAVTEIKTGFPKPLQVRSFSPHISEMNYLALSDSESEIASFAKNMPVWGLKYSFALEEVRKLDIPAVNIGPYGKDVRKQWERIDAYYSMQIVPNLTYRVILNLFQS